MSKIKKGGISSNELFSMRLENREKIQKWEKEAGIPISKKIIIDFTFIDNINIVSNDYPTKEDVIKIIKKLSNLKKIQK